MAYELIFQSNRHDATIRGAFPPVPVTIVVADFHAKVAFMQNRNVENVFIHRSST